MSRQFGAVLFILIMGMVTVWANPAAALTVRVNGVITQAGGPLELGKTFHGLLRYDENLSPAIADDAYRFADRGASLRLKCGDIVLESTGGLTLTVGGDGAVSRLTVEAGRGWKVINDDHVTRADMTIGFIPGVASRTGGTLPREAGFERFWADGSAVTFQIADNPEQQAVGDIHAVSVLPTPVGAAITLSLLFSGGVALVLGRRRRKA